jgi:hypothetical protein
MIKHLFIDHKSRAHQCLRIVNYDAEGWVITARGSIQQIEDGIEMLRDKAIKPDKNPDKFKIIVIISPRIVSHSNKDSDRKKDEEQTHSPFIGTIDDIGRDLQILREIGVEQGVFSYHFLPEEKDVQKIVQISKELSLFAR